MNKTLLTLSTVLLAGTLLSTGCSREEFGSKMFSKFDTNSDGFVNHQEYLSLSAERFDKLDDNDDNKVTFKEAIDNRFAKKMPHIAKSLFTKYDIDKNLEVTKEEMQIVTQKEFLETDINKDKKLTQKEMKIFRKNQIFERIDTNKDNMISKEEFQNMQSPFNK